MNLYDVVALLEDLPAEGLKRRQVGTIVEIWEPDVYIEAHGLIGKVMCSGEQGLDEQVTERLDSCITLRLLR